MNTPTIEYRIPVPVEQDAQVQDLARRLAKERGERRVPIRQIVREAIDMMLRYHEATGTGTSP